MPFLLRSRNRTPFPLTQQIPDTVFIMNPHDNPGDSYMFLITGYEWDRGMTLEDARKALDSMMAWVDGLLKKGVATSSSPLARMGKIVAGKNGASITDGPFTEAKEVVGGYIVVTAPDLDAAATIAAQCPLLEHGVTLDVRAMIPDCSISKRLREQEAATTAAA